MTPQKLGRFLKHWLWLLGFVTLFCAGTTYLVSSRLPKGYESSAKLLVTPGSSSTSATSFNDIQTAERLTQTYSTVIRTRPIVMAAAAQVGIAGSYESVSRLLDAKPITNTQLIQITAQGDSPDQAAAFANALASVFIRQTQDNQSSRYAASEENLRKQSDQLASDIADRTREIDALRTQPSSATRDADLARAQSDLSQLQQSYANAVRAFEDVRVADVRTADALQVVEPASPQPVPVQPRTSVNVFLAAVVGLLLATSAAFVTEYFDDRLTTAERLTRFTGLQPLGLVSSMPADAARIVDRMPTPGVGTYGYSTGGSQGAEAFRVLRANLQFASIERPVHTLLVTSSDPGDGKSTSAANLAIVAAQAGQIVLLVDADLRRPSMHEVFELPNRRGLTSLLLDPRVNPRDVIQPTRVQGLGLLTSGPLPPNPSEMLGSQRMRHRLAELAEGVDLVILDSPPVRPVSDPVVLAGLADATLLVVNSQKTRGQTAHQVVATLNQAGANLLGAVLNRVKPQKDTYYGYYPSQTQAPEARSSTA